MTNETTENVRLRKEQIVPESSRTFRKRMEKRVGRVLLRVLVGPIRALPLPLARSLGRGLGSVAYRTMGRYRRNAHKNLGLVYGADLTSRQRKRIARDVFRHFGQVATEFLKLPQMDRARVDALVTVVGEEHLKAALDGGRGALMMTGHFGNWEFLSRWLTTHDYKLNVVARDARDPAANKLMAQTREGGGANVLYRGGSARGVLQALKRNELVGILPDQNAADVFVPFLGQPTGTVDGPALLHMKTRAPLVFSWCVRTAENRFLIIFEPPEVVPVSGRREVDIARVMTLVNARLGAMVLRYPSQWLWLHDRWKASPVTFPDLNALKSRTPRGVGTSA